MNLSFTRAFTAAIKAQASLRLPPGTCPLPNPKCYFFKFPNWLFQATDQFMINKLVN